MNPNEHIGNEYDAMIGDQKEGETTIYDLIIELKEARDFAEQMHELVDWQEGFIEIPWKIA